MHYLYIIKSTLKDRHYIGITENISSRLGKHNSGSVRSTKAYRPWKLVHVEKFHDKTEARRREIFLKRTARARKELFNQIDSGLIV